MQQALPRDIEIVYLVGRLTPVHNNAVFPVAVDYPDHRTMLGEIKKQSNL